MFIRENVTPSAPLRKGPRRETVEYKAFKTGKRIVTPVLSRAVFDAAVEIRAMGLQEDHERILSRRFGLTRHEVASIILACGAGFERGYRSLRLTMQSGLQIAEQVRQQTMEEVA